MGKLLKFFVWVAAIAGIVIGAARLTVLRWWRVPHDPILAASIAPTLRAGDLVLLWRATPPSFGSLVVCPDPEDPTRVVIGRIAGEGRDVVSVDGDRLQINDKNAHTESACDDFQVEDPNTGSIVDQRCDIEALGGESHMRGQSGGTGRVQVKTVRTIAEGNVFLLSDNRAYPYDSRNYGAVERATCKESIFFRVVSRRGFMDVKPRFTYIR